ncbi:MAG: hypothetical protein IKM51_03980 [Oscillospiraceae bacterium]|nr:hypothetical protein [Oscillospiraceae bacterium]
MAALRKTLGSADHPTAKKIINLLSTQSLKTLVEWSCDYAEDYYMPILRDKNAVDERLTAVIGAIRDWLDDKISAAGTRPFCSEALQAARDSESSGDPVVTAATRAISTACAVIHTPTNALGFAFYGAAAYAYKEAGLKADKLTYDRLASMELNRVLATLQGSALEDEEFPLQIDWNC